MSKIPLKLINYQESSNSGTSTSSFPVVPKDNRYYYRSNKQWAPYGDHMFSREFINDNNLLRSYPDNTIAGSNPILVTSTEINLSLLTNGHVAGSALDYNGDIIMAACEDLDIVVIINTFHRTQIITNMAFDTIYLQGSTNFKNSDTPEFIYYDPYTYNFIIIAVKPRPLWLGI